MENADIKLIIRPSTSEVKPFKMYVNNGDNIYIGVYKTREEAKKIFQKILNGEWTIERFKDNAKNIPFELGEKIIKYFYKNHNNGDATIAKKFGVCKYDVSNFISKHLKEKFDLLNKKINSGIKRPEFYDLKPNFSDYIEIEIKKPTA